MPMEARYYDLNTYFRRRFGERVHKLAVDAGLTCPNRNGVLGRGGCIYCNAQGSDALSPAAFPSPARQLEEGKQAVARRFGAQVHGLLSILFEYVCADPTSAQDQCRGAGGGRYRRPALSGPVPIV